MIENKKLNSNEKKWLEKMLSSDFNKKNEIVEQINQADILREYTDYYLSTKFIKTYTIENRSESTGVPLEMRVYLKDEVPIQFLLRVRKGIATELEVFKADSSKIQNDIDLDNARIEILIDPEWK